MTNSPLQESDPEIFSTIHDETTRQQDSIELIASENFTSAAVREAWSKKMRASSLS